MKKRPVKNKNLQVKDKQDSLKSIKKALGRTKPALKKNKKPKQKAIEWYRPKYAEYRFPAPRKQLRMLPTQTHPPAIAIEHGRRDQKMIALTFDACSTLRKSRIDRSVIQTLIKTRTPATLFLGGKWVLDRPKDAKKLASYPFFEIGNHAYLHGHLTKVSRQRLHYELRWTQEIIYTVLGRIPTTFRPPYIEFDKRVVKEASQLGLYSIIGDLPSGDPDPNIRKRAMTRYVLKKAQNGSIIVMHMNRGGHHTGKALPGIIRGLKRKGFTFVTVAQLLKAGIPKQEPPKMHREMSKKRKRRRRHRSYRKKTKTFILTREPLR